MENVRPINHVQVLRDEWKKIFLITLLVLLLALLYSLVQPFLYRSSVSVLVLQKSSFSIDAYSATKSEERVANKLSQVIYSSLFLDQIINSGFNVDKSYFPLDELKRRQKWGKTVSVEVPVALSRLNVFIYHTDPNQALQISQAVAYILTSNKSQFIGIEDIELKVLDTPLVSKYPVRPNIAVNLFLGLLFGLMIGVAYVVITFNPEKAKLFGTPNRKKDLPHLVNNSRVKSTASVESAMAKVEKIPEIKELEDVPELAKAEALPNKPVEEMSLPDLKLDTPEISSDFEEKFFTPSPPKEAPKTSAPIKDDRYPSFSDEEKIIGLPEQK